jgi:hypothetical protein
VNETDLSITKTTVQPAYMTFTLDKAYWGRRWELHKYAHPISHAVPIVQLQPYVNKMLANVNPNVPIVDVPLAFRELYDIPKMVYQLGRVLTGRISAGDIPGGHLAIQWGWIPLFNDLSKLANLAQEIEEQGKRLDKAKRGSLRVGLGSETTSWSGPISGWISPDGYSRFRYQRRHENKRRAWATLRVEPDFSNQYWDSSPSRTVHRAVGLYSEGVPASTIWNMIPWTWLIDYFASVSSYLEATRGVLPFSVNSYCIMVEDDYIVRQVKYDEDLGLNGSPEFEHSDGWLRKQVKRRYTGQFPKARVTFTINPITGRLGVLSSLAAVTALRGGGGRG